MDRAAQLCVHHFEIQKYSIPQLSTNYLDARVPLSLCPCRSVVRGDIGYIPIYCRVCKGPFYQKDLFKCENNHFICGACYHFDLVNCEDESRFVEAETELAFLHNLYYECKWGCGQTDRFKYLDHHHVACESQPLRKCPVGTCDFSGTLKHIFQHYQGSHSREGIKMYDYWNSDNPGVYLLEDIGNDCEWHYLVSNLFVEIRCVEYKNSYNFSMEICDEIKEKPRCCAWVKYNGQRGYKALDVFSVPKGTTCVEIRVFVE